jgi:nucleotide-binding universal stress UspA family protein
MINLRKILITTDLSGHSTAAFEYALSLGLLYASRVYILYVAEHASPLFGRFAPESAAPQETARIEEAAMTKLADFISAHVGNDRKIIPVVRSGNAEQEILRFAQEEGIDLIVMATHGWTGLQHLILGSVAERVVRRSPIPVLTVKPRPARDELVRAEDVDTQLHVQ